jgi:hypothetical protein
MKTVLTYILLIIITLYGCKQTEKKTSGIDVSIRDRNWAETEFKHDTNFQLMLISVGMPRETDGYFWSILKDDYNIGMKFGVGCMVDSGTEYYNAFMRKEILKKHGSSFFEKVHAKIDSTYQIDKPLIQKIKQLDFVDTTRILNYKTYNTPDSSVKVISGYGWKKFNKRIYLTNLFRVTIDRHTLIIKNIDKTNILEEPFRE